jgi:hypothetical protein
MYLLSTLNTELCADGDDHVGADIEQDPTWLCNALPTYYETFNMFLTTNWVFLTDRSFATPGQVLLSYAFGSVIGILMLNIVIANISEVFGDEQKIGQRSFWRNRLDYAIECQHLFILSSWWHNHQTADEEGGAESEPIPIPTDEEGDAESEPNPIRDRLQFSKYVELEQYSGDDNNEQNSEDMKFFLWWFRTWEDEREFPG